MWLLGALSAILLVLAGCASPGRGSGGSSALVVASLYPVAFVVDEVGADLVEVENLTPPGAEPHDLELTPGQVRALADADLIVYLGEGFQPSLEDALNEVEAPQIDVLDAQQDLLEAPDHEQDGEEELHSDAEEQEHADEADAAETPTDPHVWLDPQRLSAVAEAVAERLAQVDPDNADRFRDNVAELQSRLDSLDEDIREGLARCERSTFVTSHEAFGYLADAYGLQEIGISGIDPEAEPSPRRLAQVAEFVEQNDVTTIFFEVLVPPQTAETLAAEVGVETARLDPLEGPPDSGDYITGMRANLDALRRGLGCK